RSRFGEGERMRQEVKEMIQFHVGSGRSLPFKSLGHKKGWENVLAVGWVHSPTPHV
ncbi:hypothetical protein A2U01_0067303, partial [Trifolium medium]|nr:hypothetical protein [Trifolium medium]